MKKLVPVYKPSDEVPKKYLNLRKAVHVTSFKHLYPNIVNILSREYGLKSNEKIVVFWMKEVPKRGWSRYRLPFKRVYSGPLSKFGEHCKRQVLNDKTSQKNDCRA